MGKLQFTPEDYQKAAIKYRKELLMLPIIGLDESMKYMTPRPGIRYQERVGTAMADAQFAPYDATRETDLNLKIDYRTLETHFGSVIANFEPNSAISTILGMGATKGDGQMQTPTAKLVLAHVAKQLGGHLNDAIFNATFSAHGTTSKDLFDGFDTITQKEVTATNIQAEKGNYYKIPEKLTKVNAVDKLKEAYFKLDKNLRKQEINIYCSQDIVDLYNEGYLMSHSGLVYNTAYDQIYLEGSNGRARFVPLANKADSKFIQFTTKDNMLVGFDQMSDAEQVMVKEYKPFVLSYIATMFFGVQFESIDKSRLFVAELTTV